MSLARPRARIEERKFGWRVLPGPDQRWIEFGLGKQQFLERVLRLLQTD